MLHVPLAASPTIAGTTSPGGAMASSGKSAAVEHAANPNAAAEHAGEPGNDVGESIHRLGAIPFVEIKLPQSPPDS